MYTIKDRVTLFDIYQGAFDSANDLSFVKDEMDLIIYVENYAYIPLFSRVTDEQINKIISTWREWNYLVESGEATQDKFNLIVKMPLEAEEARVDPSIKTWN